MTDRPQKITFADMRDMGVRGLLIYCADYRCSHLDTAIAGGTTFACRTSNRDLSARLASADPSSPSAKAQYWFWAE
jgi:hypothetical protein